MRPLILRALLALAMTVGIGATDVVEAWAAVEPVDLARCARSVEANDEEIALCTQLLAGSDATPEERARILAARAQRYRSAGKLNLALADLTAAIALNPNSSYHYLNRGNIQTDRRRYDQAISDYTRSIELRPDSAVAFQNRAGAYFSLKRYEESQRDNDEALRLRPGYAYAYDGRGNILWARGDFAAALAEYDTAVKLDPTVWSFWRNRANLHRDTGRLDMALADFTAAIDRSPRNADLFHARGVVHLYRGAYAEAAQDLAMAAGELKSANRYAALWLGLATARAGGDGRIEVLRVMPGGTPVDWVPLLLRYFVGHVGLAEVEKSISGAEPMVARERACDLAYVTAMLAISRNDKVTARAKFEAAAGVDRNNLVCSLASRHELQRLGPTAAKAKAKPT